MLTLVCLTVIWCKTCTKSVPKILFCDLLKKGKKPPTDVRQFLKLTHAEK